MSETADEGVPGQDHPVGDDLGEQVDPTRAPGAEDASAAGTGAADGPQGPSDTGGLRLEAARLRAAAAPQVERVKYLISEAAERTQDPHGPAIQAAAAASAQRPPLAEPDLAAAEGANRSLVWLATTVQRRLPRFGMFVAFAAAVYGRYARHRGSVLAGGLAFFGMLSVVPSVLSLGAVIALFVDPQTILAQTDRFLAGHPDVAAALEPFLQQWLGLSHTSITTIGVAGLVGLAFSLYAASRFVYVGRQVLDIAFEVRPRPPSVLSRAMSVVVTVVLQIGLVAALVSLSLLPRVLAFFGLESVYLNNLSLIRTLLVIPVVYLLLTAGLRFGMASRVVPWLNWGCAVGTVVIAVGTVGLGWYLSVSVTYSQIVAVLGGVIALELWLYIIGLAIVLSAEIEALRLGFWHGRPGQTPVAWADGATDDGQPPA